MYRAVVFAIAAFTVLMAAEFAYGLARGRNSYRLADTVSSLSQGLLSQWIGVSTRLFQVGLYAVAYEHFALLRDGGLWQSWGGWILALLLFDFCEYWLHRVGHRSAIFWAAHVVHHQSRQFNFSTALRQESLTAILGWPFYLPMALAGVPPELFLGAGLAVNFYQFWIHTEHVGRLGWLDRVFSTPSNHRVHHATNGRYLDKNYGGVLVVWDRLFGTFEEEREPCVYGTVEPLASHDPLFALTSVYRSIARQAWRTPRWRDKLRTLFMPPGWRPAGWPQEAPGAPAPEETARAGRGPALALFLVLVLGSCLFLWNAETVAPLAAGAGTLAFLAALMGVGRLLRPAS